MPATVSIEQSDGRPCRKVVLRSTVALMDDGLLRAMVVYTTKYSGLALALYSDTISEIYFLPANNINMRSGDRLDLRLAEMPEC